MKRLLIATALIVSATPAIADEYVNGYYRQNGTYVHPYHRSDADGNPYNNYSSQGNVNPYTGQQGHVNPYAQHPTYRSVQQYNGGYYR